jgi:hypothetical protein
MTITIELGPAQLRAIVASARRQARAVAVAATRGAVPEGFVFFAAFDGTSNDRANEGSAQNTNVVQLWDQFVREMGNNPRLGGGYYPGPGTKGTLSMSSWLPDRVQQQVQDTADLALEDFARQAADWRARPANAGRPMSVVVTAFSRGCASAALFAQRVHERGVPVAAGVLFDPVMTGVDASLAYPPTTANVVSLVAANEYRQLFRAGDYRGHSGITTVRMPGNHCDVGGGYDNGLAALCLEAATSYLRTSGLRIARVDAARAFDPAAVTIHDESRNPDETEAWSAYASFSSLEVNEDVRLFDRIY